ncbi:ABC transporter ATP-binding protein [Paraferrimonas sp. SM1919]|uniref:ABC transporter ATP-binding protein n=1 Tax=Paraferrimonas sp. SM1919 TaxID=2662263 RepID=UPI0013CFA5BF|nr:ABC transporter ATP-binding protein [Paraferrimonas sp. SM1919]
MAEQAPLLSLKQVSLSYGHGEVLKAIDLQLDHGELVALVGPNGSGKTSLLNSINGFIAATGLIQIAGQDLQQLSSNTVAKLIASVSQHQDQQIALSVKEFVSLGLLPQLGLWQKISFQQQGKIESYLRQFDLLDKLNTPLSELSGGQRQRAHIVKSLLQQPRLLLLDEPNNHLDIEHQLHLLNYLKKQSFTSLISLHDLNLAAQFCDKVIILNEGSLFDFGTPEQVLNQHNIAQVFKVNCKIDAHYQQGLAIQFSSRNP